MGYYPWQGDILKIEYIQVPVLVVSRDYFNESGEIIGCPLLAASTEGPLHIFVSDGEMGGYVQCEKLKLLDLSVRGYKKTGQIGTMDRMNITDAVQSIFDYF
ncbi:MAG: type II toxin-antitoxin system PemK/MazF family toxin [Lachnospiraceae bacterium]|nr:type II toxin-antitoxin system PemK/MazF family toxin [Lachnospiraceae bacterium]